MFLRIVSETETDRETTQSTENGLLPFTNGEVKQHSTLQYSPNKKIKKKTILEENPINLENIEKNFFNYVALISVIF